MSIKLSKNAARAMSNEIKSGMILTESKIRKFINGEGWFGCGYDSFHAWWSNELSELTLAREIRPHIIYTMFEEGKSDLEIAMAIKGVGAETIKVQRNKFQEGLPPSVVVIPSHVRNVEISEVRSCRVEFNSKSEYDKVCILAKQDGLTLSQYGRKMMMGL